MQIPTPDGRVLQVLDTGGDGLPCVFHNGTPGGPVLHQTAIAAAQGAGLRWITYARPGYGDSTALPGRSVAQAAVDTATVLDFLGLSRFVTYGWSGGGPHALACAALLPDRCLAATTIASVAPSDAEGLDFLAGMAEENVEEFSLALKGRDAVRPYLEAALPGMRQVSAAGVSEAFGSLISPVDHEALTGDLAEFLASSCREAVRVGLGGWLDDDLAFATHWGFDLGAITRPVALWQGREDRMVPFAHGEWLAAHVSGARAHLLDDQGHLSLGSAHLPVILAELRDLAA